MILHVDVFFSHTAALFKLNKAPPVKPKNLAHLTKPLRAFPSKHSASVETQTTTKPHGHECCVWRLNQTLNHTNTCSCDLVCPRLIKSTAFKKIKVNQYLSDIHSPLKGSFRNSTSKHLCVQSPTPCLHSLCYVVCILDKIIVRQCLPVIILYQCQRITSCGTHL